METTQGLFAFVRAVEAGSFSGAAKMLGTTPSAVSRSIARLEQRLNARLFLRSTRRLNLTAEGQAYFDRVAPLLRALEDSDEVIRPHGSNARGILRVTLPSVLGPILMDGIVRELLPTHPDLNLQVNITDRHVDLISEGFDLALRAGTLPDSGLTAKSLGTIALRLVASPEYLDTYGRPTNREDLKSHRHLRYLADRQPYPLQFADGASILPMGRLDVDSGAVLLRAAQAGAGIVQLLHPVVEPFLSDHSLEEILPHHPLARVDAHFLHAFDRNAPTRARVFMDFVSTCLERVRG